MAMSTEMKNVMRNEALVNRIDELAKKRKTWEEGTYKASNAELCMLLDECYAIYEEARVNKSLAKRIGQLVEERKLIVQANTSLATRIVRLVFGNCGKRAYSYAKVLTVAAEEKRDNESMLTFVNNRNGVENIRRRKAYGATDSELKAEYVEFADEVLSAGEAIIADIEATIDMEADENAAYKYAVALLRTDGKGKASIVYTTNAAGVVRAALINAGKKLKTQIEGEEKNAKIKHNALKRKEVLEKIAA